MSISEQRDGVDLTNLDQPLGPATKRDLVDYLEAVADRMLPDSSGGHSPCCCLVQLKIASDAPRLLGFAT